MENQKSTSKQLMVNYGLLLGFLSILIAVANFAIGDVYEPHWIISVISILALAVVIILGIKKFKDGNNGFLKLGEALKLGLGIALISGLIYVGYLLIFTNFIEPEFYTRMAQVQEQTLIEKYPNMSDEQLEGAIEMTKKFSNPVMTSAITMIFSLFLGFIVALIGGLIMKKTEE